MTNNNNNSEAGWKDRLGNYRDDGEGTFDPAKAWDTLYGRLHDKKPSRRWLFYWLPAAAAATAAIWLLWLLPGGAARQLPKPPGNILAGLRSQEMPVIRPVAGGIVRAHPLAAASGAHERRSFAGNQRSAGTSPMISARVHTNAGAIGSLARQSVDTVVTIAVTATSRIPLRIVHVNELGDANPEPFQYKTGEQGTAARFRFMDQQVWSLPNSEEKTGHRLFIIKTN